MTLICVKHSVLRLCVLFMAAEVARAGPVTWDMQGVMFSDGAVASGYFVYDADTQDVTDWSVMTSTSGLFQGFFYTATTSIAVTNVGGCDVDFIAAENSSQFLCLNPASALVAGASPDLLPSSLESGMGGSRTIATGDLQDPPTGPGAAIPEPTTLSSVALALSVISIFSSQHLRLFRFPIEVTPSSSA